MYMRNLESVDKHSFCLYTYSHTHQNRLQFLIPLGHHAQKFYLE